MNLQELHREFDWRLQNALHWSAPVLKRTAQRWDSVHSGLTPEQRARANELAAAYDLTAWPSVCTQSEMLLNLYTLDIAARLLTETPHNGRALDIGAGNWSYLPALLTWSGVIWDGVELDAYRRYWTLSTRQAHAAYMQRLCQGCRYIAGSLLDVRGSYNLITWFLPFVLPEALRAGQLPERYFQPQELLAHAWSLLSPGGTLVIVNQGEAEAQQQQVLCANAGLHARMLGELTSVFSRYTQARFAWKIVKPP